MPSVTIADEFFFVGDQAALHVAAEDFAELAAEVIVPWIGQERVAAELHFASYGAVMEISDHGGDDLIVARLEIAGYRGGAFKTVETQRCAAATDWSPLESKFISGCHVGSTRISNDFLAVMAR